MDYGLVAGRKYTFRLQLIRYGWADKLFDHFTTINAPADDYSVNVDPSDQLRTDWGNELKNAANATPSREYIPNPVPNANQVKNAKADSSHLINRGPTSQPTKLTEDDVPAEGLININTASWRVLAQLPLVMANATQVDRVRTEYLARQIVYFRDVDDGRGIDPNLGTFARVPHPHGPLKSVYELLMIPEFETGDNTLPTQNPLRDSSVAPLPAAQNFDPNSDVGDFSPLRAGVGDGVRWDWKEKYLMINRISNLITLKSDCFTVYLQVQAWRDAGTDQATMVSQRRQAFIIDRSRIFERRLKPNVYNVPVAEYPGPTGFREGGLEGARRLPVLFYARAAVTPCG
jgi:hypothetical protein